MTTQFKPQFDPNAPAEVVIMFIQTREEALEWLTFFRSGEVKYIKDNRGVLQVLKHCHELAGSRDPQIEACKDIKAKSLQGMGCLVFLAIPFTLIAFHFLT